jgi:hypothetical protein
MAEKYVYVVDVDGMDGSPFVFARENHAQQVAGELLMRDVDVDQEDVRIYETDDDVDALIARLRSAEGEET